MAGKIIGLDFSGSAVSMVLVAFSKAGHQVMACERVPLGDGEDWHGVAEALSRIRQDADADEATCIAAIPDEWISYRIIPLPFSDRKKVGRVIGYEMEPLLPFALEDTIIDFQPAATSVSTDHGADMITAAALKVRLRDFIEKVNALGLEPEVITSRGLAIAAVLSAYKQEGLFIDGNGRRLVVGVIAGEKVRFIHSLSLGRGQTDRSRMITAALGHVLIADEERHSTDSRPDTVYAAGEPARLDGIKEAVESSLAVNFRKMDIPGLSGLSGNGCSDEAGQGGGFEVALCLTLLKRLNRRFIDFRKDEFAVTGKWRQYSDVFIRTGLCVTLVIAIGLAGFFYELHGTRKQITAVEARIAGIFKTSFPETPLIDDPLRQMRMELERLKGTSGLPAEMQKKAYYIDILNDISRLMPPNVDVVIDRMVAGPDDVMLSGHTDSFNAVDMMKNEFGKSAFFSKIDISSATMNKTDKRVSFKLQLELR